MAIAAHKSFSDNFRDNFDFREGDVVNILRKAESDTSLMNP